MQFVDFKTRTATKKACNSVYSPPKPKHVRTIIVRSFNGGVPTFYSELVKTLSCLDPLKVYKSFVTLHKVIIEGSPSLCGGYLDAVLPTVHQVANTTQRLNAWYALQKLTKCYVKYLELRFVFIIKFPFFDGALKIAKKVPEEFYTDKRSLEILSYLMDLMDTLLVIPLPVIHSYGADITKLDCAVPLINDSFHLFNAIALFIGNIAFVNNNSEVFQFLFGRLEKIYKSLQMMYDAARKNSYITSLIGVPVLPPLPKFEISEEQRRNYFKAHPNAFSGEDQMKSLFEKSFNSTIEKQRRKDEARAPIYSDGRENEENDNLRRDFNKKAGIERNERQSQPSVENQNSVGQEKIGIYEKQQLRIREDLINTGRSLTRSIQGFLDVINMSPNSDEERVEEMINCLNKELEDPDNVPDIKTHIWKTFLAIPHILSEDNARGVVERNQEGVAANCLSDVVELENNLVRVCRMNNNKDDVTEAVNQFICELTKQKELLDQQGKKQTQNVPLFDFLGTGNEINNDNNVNCLNQNVQQSVVENANTSCQSFDYTIPQNGQQNNTKIYPSMPQQNGFTNFQYSQQPQQNVDLIDVLGQQTVAQNYQPAQNVQRTPNTQNVQQKKQNVQIIQPKVIGPKQYVSAPKVEPSVVPTYPDNEVKGTKFVDISREVSKQIQSLDSAKIALTANPTTNKISGVFDKLYNLIRVAGDCEEDRLRSGKTKGSNLYYDNEVWEEGLLSCAKKIVEWAKAISEETNATDDWLVAALKQFSALSSQLVAAARATLDPNSPLLRILENCLSEVIKDVNAHIQRILDSRVKKVVSVKVSSNPVTAKKNLMESEVKVLELQRQLQEAQDKLYQLRKDQYN
ncbi:hypothetical protein EIN_467880 [Entamoeba invadens IP1]|uniref:I/LWEQ domain-containing protein n=1 Tax=Entamoeba invadens IP1 TaxID=370355 RepID=A0A0A1TUH8_ENTIV|nr:hypothetical protein EIN_467880 [Entamoeba invadens IP1]ELP83674.1 hypothetical protein EIN_467880 [Entamoeba invadens IP1]|eukprot:XP_004183020.1 hypothetical protein EIN_467880 [Entamoeba invadens IP1]